MSGIFLKGGRVIDPAGGFDGVADLLLLDGRIASAEVIARWPGQEPVTTIECAGCWVVPGLIDPHVHLRDPGNPEKETIFSGLRAAAAGGFTTVAAMANTAPVNDTPEITHYMIERAAQAGGAHLVPVAAVTKGLAGRELIDVAAMAAAGARLFSDDGIPIDDAALLATALRSVTASGFVISLHEEDRALTANGAMNEGATARRLGVRGIPSGAESARVERDLEIALGARAPVHVAHISTAEAVRAVREARQRGLAVTCEATPHHFMLEDDAVLECGANARMSPPLRSRRDRDAIRAAIADGTIDMIATDHAPHDSMSKGLNLLGPLFGASRRGGRLSSDEAQALAAAANGVVGLETALGLALAMVHEGLITPQRMVEMMSLNPARLLRLEGAGRLTAGARSDVTVIDPNYPWIVDPSKFLSLSRNTPFAGRELKGRAMLSIVEGKIVYDARVGRLH
ncbi:MAG TPA: dihydroorotase [Candidatus Binataceae bacterium]|nr:dihydroorotase [Candidatus Binataceae bacterium]